MSWLCSDDERDINTIYSKKTDFNNFILFSKLILKSYKGEKHLTIVQSDDGNNEFPNVLVTEKTIYGLTWFWLFCNFFLQFYENVDITIFLLSFVILYRKKWNFWELYFILKEKLKKDNRHEVENDLHIIKLLTFFITIGRKMLDNIHIIDRNFMYIACVL